MREHTDAPPIFHQACALTMMGALLTRESHRCVVRAGAGGTWTNFWVLLVGDSGKDRKSECIRLAYKSSIGAIDPSLKGPDDMSPEGLLTYLQHRDTGMGNVTGEIVGGASGLLIQSEFIHLLHQFRRQWSAALRPILLRLYDVEDTFKRTLKKQDFEIRQPKVSIIGGIPPTMLARYGTPEDWDGGFFNRFVIIQGRKEREQAHLPVVSDEVYLRHSIALKTCLDRWQQTVTSGGGALTLSKEAHKIYASLPMEHRDMDVTTMWARSQLHFVKVAAIAQVDLDPTSSIIGKEAAQYAHEFISYWQAGIPELVGNYRTAGREEFEGNKPAKMLRRYIDRKGEALEVELQGLFFDSAMYERAMSTLRQMNLITNVGCKLPGAWRLCKPGETSEGFCDGGGA